MKVKDLIAELSRCNQDATVRMFVDWNDEREIDEVSRVDADGFVVIGNSLPAEKHAEDYKYD